MSDKKQWYYFTFLYGSENRKKYVKFFGTYSEAREKMFEHFGDRWAFQYNEKEFSGQIEKFGLQELKIYPIDIQGE